MRFRLQWRVQVGCAVSLLLLRRERGSLSLQSARVEPSVREAAAKAMRDSTRAHTQPSASSFTSASALLHAESALDVDPALDGSLFSRLTWTMDISPICRRELEELSAASALHLAASQSAAGPDELYYQFLLAAQEAVYRRLEHWGTAHPDSSQQSRSLLAHAHAAQRKAEEEARERENSRREEAQRSAKEARQRKAAAAAMRGTTASHPSGSRPPQPPPKVNLGDSAAWPALGGGGGGGRGEAAAALQPPRPIRALQPRPKPAQDTEPASRQPPASAEAASAEPPSSSSWLAPASPAASSSSPPRNRSSAFFNSDEEDEEGEAVEAEAARASSLQPLAALSGLAPLASAPSFAHVDAGRCYYFYQALDGQCLFLHSLCYRALLHEHGNDPARLPPVLTATVEAVEEGVMDAAVASRFRFLSHLPSSLPFKLLSVSLAQLVQPATAAVFAEEWKEEQRARQRRQQQHQRQLSRRAHRHRQQQQHSASGGGRWSSSSPYGSSSSTSPSSPYSASSPSQFAASAYAATVWGDDEGEVDAASVAELLDSFPALQGPAAAPHSPHSPAAVAGAALSSQQPLVVGADAAPSPAFPPLSPSAAPSQPLPGWNAIAERGLAATSTWASLPAAAHTQPAPPSPSHPPLSPSSSPLLSPSTHWGRGLQQQQQQSGLPTTSSATAAAATAAASTSHSSSSSHRLRFRPLEG